MRVDLEKSTLDRKSRATSASPRSETHDLALTVVHHPDVARVGEVARLEELAQRGASVGITRATPAFAPPGGGERRGLGTPYLSRNRNSVEIASGPPGQLELRPGTTAVETEVAGTALTRPLAVAQAEIEDGIILTLADRIVVCLHWMARERDATPEMGIIGESDAIVDVRRRILQVADLEVPILIRGETGTGKELVARAVAKASGRADGTLIALNMAAVPPSLAAAMLFGHEKGAFTGAAISRAGCFGEAAGGTLFLDEIGATPFDVQPMLLRALESGEIFPLGARRAARSDARVIAATDADLETSLAARSFLPELYHRLARFQIRLPSLRRRREDFGRLLLHFFREGLKTTRELHRLEPPKDDEAPWISASQVARLACGAWPGNVRALINAAHHIVIASRGRPHAHLDEDLDLLMNGMASVAASEVVRTSAQQRARQDEFALEQVAEDIPRETLVEALSAKKWSTGRAAAALGIPRSTLSDLMDRHKIPRVSSYSEAEIRSALRSCEGDVALAAAKLKVSKRSLAIRLAQTPTGRARTKSGA